MTFLLTICCFLYGQRHQISCTYINKWENLWESTMYLSELPCMPALTTMLTCKRQNMCNYNNNQVKYTSFEMISPVTHSATLGKIQCPLLIFTRKMFILTDVTNIYVPESIASRISTYFILILCLRNHAMCLRCFAFKCKLIWDFYYNSSCLQRIGVVKVWCQELL